MSRVEHGPESVNPDPDVAQNAAAFMAANPSAGPLVRLRVRRRLKQKLEKAKENRKAINSARQQVLYALVDDAAIDAAYAEALAAERTPVGGPIIEWILNNPELINRIVDILLKLLLG